MSLHPHLHRTLVAWVKANRKGNQAGATFALLGDKNIGGLRARSFVSQSKYNLTHTSKRTSLTAVPDAEAAGFPSGLPGFPNRLLRADFDLAWAEALL